MSPKKFKIKNTAFIARQLKNASDFSQALSVQQQSWGLKDIDIIPTHFMTAVNEWSFQVGIFDKDRLVSLALIYPTDKKNNYLLHMLCTIPNYRNLGLGKTLLQLVITHLKSKKDSTLHWTFDPFDFVNSHLYLNKIKAIAYKAKLNYYGEIDSLVHGSLPSHRLFCKVDCRENQVKRYSNFKEVQLPYNINSLKLLKHEEAIAIMNSIFKKIQKYLKDGFLITDFKGESNGNKATLILNK